MISKKNLLFLVTIIGLTSCGSNSANTTETAAEIAIQKETEQLDSLSEELGQSAQEIENSTKALEESLQELDDTN
jgi:molecular chaperone GrpE (heat shock protein)